MTDDPLPPGTPELVRALRIARTERGLSQADIAGALATSQRQVSQWETGIRPILLADAVAYAEAVGLVLRLGAWATAGVCEKCGGPHLARRMCRPCYMRWWRANRDQVFVPVGDDEL